VKASPGYLAFLHVEVVDDDADEKVESEKRAEDDEEDEIHVHIIAVLSFWLLIRLQVRDAFSVRSHAHRSDRNHQSPG